MKTPFEYTTPEAMPASDVVDLFVPVFSEYYNVPNVGHTFIHGPRGCGKSMMFRYMSPECQCIAHGKRIKDLDYLSIHIQVKEGQLDKTDLSLLENKHGEALLNEHFMVINFTIKIFEKLSEMKLENSPEGTDALIDFYENSFMKHLRYSRVKETIDLPEGIKSLKDVFWHMKEICSGINREFTMDFLYHLVCAEGPIPYKGPICTFSDFLLPILQKIRQLPFMPNAPFFLLVDDADNLNNVQVRILNTWVSQRTSKNISFKISTQLNYSTYKTINNSRIDTPHDFSEINISDIYTTKKGLYIKRVKEAVKRRLVKFGITDVEPEDFFPVDKKQEEQIKSLFKSYEKKFPGKKGYDYAYRYARADFMKSIKGNLNTYSYAGFESLVNISSGTMRHFIEFANKMYAHQIAKFDSDKIIEIDPGIQDHEIKDYSNWFFDENFSKLRDDSENTCDHINDFDKLRNLIEALGQTFHLILFSDATERRVFSFALQNDPNETLRKILKLGIENGYFQKSLIGNKMGTGKAQLYILNRLLAPHFKLDPSSFAGYKFVTCDVLSEAMCNPRKIIGRIKSKGLESVLDDSQLSLFQDN